MKSSVAVIKCDSYREDQVDTAVREGINLLGGIDAFCKNGERIVLKPNLLIGDKPEKSVTTHPSVFKALGKLFLEAGADLFYGDSPAAGKPERAAKGAGIKEVADQLGIALADFSTTVKISFPQALIAKQLPLAAGVLDCGLISISKMKTQEFKINGMSCMHCVKAVEVELSKVELEESQVEIGAAKISFDENKIDENTIINAINESGYKVIS